MCFLLAAPGLWTIAQEYSVKSPDNKIVVNISSDKKLSYSVTFRGQNIVNPSIMGFEFKDEQQMTGNFMVIDHLVQMILLK